MRPVLIPHAKQVNKDGSLNPYGLAATNYYDYPERITDLKDVDITTASNPKPGEIFLWAYIPNAEKKFTLIKVRDPRLDQ